MQQVTQPKIAIPLTFELTAGDRASLVARATRFVSLSGETAETEMADNPAANVTSREAPIQREIELERSKTRLLYLISTLESSGIHQTRISASAGNQPDAPPVRLTVTVNRSLAPPPVEIDVPAVRQIDDYWLYSDDHIPLPIGITSHLKGLTLRTPRLVGPMRFAKAMPARGSPHPLHSWTMRAGSTSRKQRYGPTNRRSFQ